MAEAMEPDGTQAGPEAAGVAGSTGPDPQTPEPPSPEGLDAARRILTERFGFRDFRPGQAEIVAALLSGRDVLAIMPTGGGKSLCYQLPALLEPRLTIVVSPLIALMRNQVAQLQSLGIPAGALHSGNSPEENRDLLRAAAEGGLKLLYVAPERLVRPDLQAALRRAGIGLLAVDEAHCVSQWGHDFRPEYMRLAEIRAELGNPRMIALTATADTATRGDIVERLFADGPDGAAPRIFVQGFDRPNLHLAMRPKERAPRQILDFVARQGGASGIVYCASRRQTEELAEMLNGKGIRALPYHAGLEPADRARNEELFLQEDGIVVTATIAFGMGIDKPDVRFVAHAALPKNIESYYQEIGRAGRDGLPAETLTLYGLDDVRLRRLQIEESDAADEQKRVERQRLNALVSLCEAPRCRRQTLLAYFGEEVAPCGHCDLCQEGVTLVDGTVPAQMALSAIARTGQRFGTEHLVAILCGDESEAIRRFQHDCLPTFGVGRERPKTEWRAIFRQVYAAGLIAQDYARHGAWTITPAGKDVLFGRQGIEIRMDQLQARDRKSKGRASGSAAAAAAEADLSAKSQALLQRLKAKRGELAKAQNVPAYVVFPDRTLIEMAQARPTDPVALGQLHGVGQAKLERYGETFLALIREAAASAA
ncbi:DNA helicase RecQ [Marinibaculum pumilum]|uniref:DNA helicase RecQ n=1 Tax=Marinibaculum pumilum TaxID=1766165 RepID=A0ABV7L990_9PROT